MTQYCPLEEAFSNYSPSQRKKKVSIVEKLEAPPKKTYSGQRSDYDYICEKAGICVYPDKFVGDASSPAPAAPHEKCEPIQPPKYEYPFTEEDKRRFRQALKIALEEMESGGSEQQQPAYAPRAFNGSNVDMSGVNGYIDEELESYMMVNDMKPAITKEKVPEPTPLQGIETTQPTAAPVPPPTPTPSPSPQPSQLSFTRKNKIWLELLLFSIGGILIILILEQLFKIAHESGMRRTVALLEKIYHCRSLEGVR